MPSIFEWLTIKGLSRSFNRTVSTLISIQFSKAKLFTLYLTFPDHISIYSTRSTSARHEAPKHPRFSGVSWWVSWHVTISSVAQSKCTVSHPFGTSCTFKHFRFPSHPSNKSTQTRWSGWFVAADVSIMPHCCLWSRSQTPCRSQKHNLFFSEFYHKAYTYSFTSENVYDSNSKSIECLRGSRALARLCRKNSNTSLS